MSGGGRITFGFEYSRLIFTPSNQPGKAVEWRRQPVAITQDESGMLEIFRKLQNRINPLSRLGEFGLGEISVSYRILKCAVPTTARYGMEMTCTTGARLLRLTQIIIDTTPFSRYLIVEASCQKALDSLLTAITLMI